MVTKITAQIVSRPWSNLNLPAYFGTKSWTSNCPTLSYGNITSLAGELHTPHNVITLIEVYLSLLISYRTMLVASAPPHTRNPVLQSLNFGTRFTDCSAQQFARLTFEHLTRIHKTTLVRHSLWVPVTNGKDLKNSTENSLVSSDCLLHITPRSHLTVNTSFSNGRDFTTQSRTFWLRRRRRPRTFCYLAEYTAIREKKNILLLLCGLTHSSNLIPSFAAFTCHYIHTL